MKRPTLVCLGVVALLLGGCVVGNRTLPAGELAPTEETANLVRVRVESRPSGALIVAGGRVVGHAPIDVLLPISRLGFFPVRTTVRARFLAEDQSQGSESVNADFSILEKVPAVVIFTPDGFRWVPR